MRSLDRFGFISEAGQDSNHCVCVSGEFSGVGF